MSHATTLDEIGLRHGTDKASNHHNYLEFYETFFAPLRQQELTVLEIGVLNGASLRTWEEYFPRARIIGVDITPAARFHERGRVIIELADQSNLEELHHLAVRYGPFDIIIEDGSHMWDHQVITLRSLFPFVKNNGIYIVEDLQTNYGAMQEIFQGTAASTCVDFLKAWLDLRVADDQVPLEDVEDAFLRTYGRSVQFLTFYRRACLIRKQSAPIVRDLTGQPLVAAATGQRGVAVAILAHVSTLGDIAGPRGFINPGPAAHSFQGIAMNAGDLLEYRIRFTDGTWSAWTRHGEFIGTRGESKLLTGFTVRLLESVRPRHAVRAIGRFAGEARIVEVADGQDCLSASGGPLCGLQVELVLRSG